MIGDSSTSIHQNHGAYWDDIRLSQSDNIQTSGFTNAFHNNQYTMLFMEDFESTLDIEEFGWGVEPGGYDDIEDPIWESGIATFGAHTGDRIAATHLYGSYGASEEGRLTLPPLDLSYVDEATLTFYIFIDAETDWDGLRVEYREQASPGNQLNDWQVLGGYGSFYNSDWVAVFQDVGFTGYNNTWQKKSVSINGLCGSGTVQNKYEISFHFKSDPTDHYYGFGIDDVKIFGKVSSNTNWDFDNDSLANWDEYYVYMSSVFIADTDNDFLSDYEEASDVDLNSFSPSNMFPGPADLCKRDVFVEFDSMADLSDPAHPLYLDDEMKNATITVVEVFSSHKINLHLCFNYLDTLPSYDNDSDLKTDKIDRDTVLSYRNQYFDNKGTHMHVMFISAEEGNPSRGSSYEGKRYCVSYITHSTLYSESDRAQTLMHEMGHAFSQSDIPNSSCLFEPYRPNDTVMIPYRPRPFDYLKEDSDVLFKNDDPLFGDLWWPYYGWEASYRFYSPYASDRTQFLYGLYFQCIDQWHK